MENQIDLEQRISTSASEKVERVLEGMIPAIPAAYQVGSKYQNIDHYRPKELSSGGSYTDISPND